MDNKIQRFLDLAANDKDHSSVSFAKRFFHDDKMAETAFTALKLKVRDIIIWNKAGALNSFKLFDKNGNERESPLISEKLLIRISMKGSGKYDWIKIWQIIEGEGFSIITVKPTASPAEDNVGEIRTSHFFTSEASNNFCLLKEADKVSFYVIGLNEKQNTSETNNPFEIIRNVATANIGSYLGIQKAEWETFCRNLLESYDSDEIL